MHYFQFNISDWTHATNHLSLEEKAIYLDLINYYYDTEGPIPVETNSVIRRLRLGSHEVTVLLLLEEFFTLTDEGWVHERCESEIAAYRSKAEKARASANARWGNATAMRTHSDRNAKAMLTINQEPLTKNQEEKKTSSSTKQAFDALGYLTEQGVDADIAGEWLAIRAAKKVFNTQKGMESALGDGKERGLSPNEAITQLWKQGHICFYADRKPVKKQSTFSKLYPGEAIDWV